MFTTSRDEDKKFEVFPEASMKSGPIFKTAEEYETLVKRAICLSNFHLHFLKGIVVRKETAKISSDFFAVVFFFSAVYIVLFRGQVKC